MGKGPGSTRASKWSGNLYNIGDTRYEYNDLPKSMQDVILDEYKKIAKELKDKIGGQSVVKDIGNGMSANIQFTTDGLAHFCRDAMVVLSGKYFSRNSMLDIKNIFEKSTFVEGNIPSYHGGAQSNELYFKYKDVDGRGVFFKAKKNTAGLYVFYSVIDQ